MGLSIIKLCYNCYVLSAVVALRISMIYYAVRMVYIPVSMLLSVMLHGNILNGDIKEKVAYISINY